MPLKFYDILHSLNQWYTTDSSTVLCLYVIWVVRLHVVVITTDIPMKIQLYVYRDHLVGRLTIESVE